MTKEKNTQEKTVKPKQLSMAQIRRTAVAANKMEDYDISDTEKIRHYPIFPQRKINELLQEFQEILQYTDEKNIEIKEEMFLPHILLLCIKHFTNLKKGISDKYEDQVRQLGYLVDSGYFEIIVSEIFMPSEIDKVIESMSDIMSRYQFMEKVSTQTMKKLQDLEVQNKNLMSDLDH